MTAATTLPLTSSSPSNPCPICGRDDKSGDCRHSNDGPIWLCHHGSSFSPPQGLKEGETHLGKDFQLWAYTGKTKDGRCSIYKLHEELRPALKLVPPIFSFARPSASISSTKGTITPDGTIYYCYSPLQQVKRTADKKFYTNSRNTKFENWSAAAGSLAWPLYNEDAVLAVESGWLLEVEGEKCCDVATSEGFVAFTQPGSLNNKELNQERYKAIKASKANGIIYLADADEAGKKKGNACKAAAEAIDLPFILLFANDLWPDLPKGGSIDDLTKEELAEAKNKLEKAAALAETRKATKPIKKEKAVASIDGDQETAKAIAALLEKLLDATLAEDQPLVDALKSRAWGYQLTRELLEERLLALWGQKKGLLAGAKAPAKSRIIGIDDPGAGLQQLQPGFMVANDLHGFFANAGEGKTLTSLELATCLSINKGFMDQQEGRSGQKGKVLYICSDGGATAWPMLNTYCDQLRSFERGAEIVVWAENSDAGEASWNVSLPNLERLFKEMEKGYVAVFIDTANAAFQAAGVSPYTGPVDKYLRLLKAIVCPTAALWINGHTTRSGKGMKSVGGHPAWQEVPSVIHRIEKIKKGEAEPDTYKWTVEKFRGESPRSFNYQRVDGEFVLVDGSHFQESINDLLLQTIQKHEGTIGLQTRPSALALATKKSIGSVYTALSRLRQQRLIKSHGTGNKLTEQGLAHLHGLEKKTDPAAEEFF